jgi:hypothetical protein
MTIFQPHLLLLIFAIVCMVISAHKKRQPRISLKDRFTTTMDNFFTDN